jgi:hypothetical protein
LRHVSEIAALKASLAGALEADERLREVKVTFDRLAGDAELPTQALDDLERVAAAHAMASHALRGLVEQIKRKLTAPA